MSSDTLRPLSDILSPEDLPANLFSAGDASNLGRIYVLRDTVAQTPVGTIFYATIAFEDRAIFNMPLLPLSLSLGAATPNSAISLRMLLEDEWYVEIDDLKFALRIDGQVLRPVDSLGEFVEIEAQGTVRITSDNIELVDPDVRLSLPPSEIAGTGIVVTFDGVRFDLSPEISPPEVLELGYDNAFRGVYAEAGSIKFLPMLRFGDDDGLIVEATDIAISQSGLTCTLSHDFNVELDESGVGATSDVVGEFFGPEWRFALDTVEAEIYNNVPHSFRATGIVSVPVLDLLCELEFRMASRSNQTGFDYAVSVTELTGGQIQTPFGTIGYETLMLDGTIEEDSAAIGGKISGLRVDLDPLHIGAESASILVKHQADHDEVHLRIADVKIDPWGTVDLVEVVLGERHADGSVSNRFVMHINNSLTIGETGVVVESAKLEIELSSDTGTLDSWQDLLDNASITVNNLRVTSPLLPGGAIAGDMRLVFKDGALQTDESYFKRYEPDDQHLIPLDLKNFHVDENCLALTWDEPRINYWLEQLAPDLFDADAPTNQELTLRVIFGDPIKEIRLDWEISDAARTFTLPGVDVTTPDNVLLSLLLGPGGDDLSRLALCLTFDENATPLIARSNFAWGRGEDRELQNDDGRASEAEPLLELSAKAKKPLSLVLLALDLDEFKLPQFLQQLQEPIAALDYSEPDKLREPTAFRLESLKEDSWDIDFEVNADGDDFTLPFLKQEEDDEEDSVSQSIKIDTSRLAEPEVDFSDQTVSVPVGITVCIGPLEFATEVSISFNWETLALNVDHDEGLKLCSEELQFAPEEEHLGLRWRLKGASVTNDEGETQYHYFTLVTKDYNYQVQQAPGAVFEVDYVHASAEDEPITFSISDFALAPKGLNVTATVTDRPAHLNGIDTRFRFSGSRLEIKENRVTDFTLSGSGPLPPALVGDSTVDISLQFGQRDGALRLVEGKADLRGTKMLDCRGTRFRFSVEGLGLRFVDDGQYHLYFLLTGSTQFAPGPSDDPGGPLALLSNIKIDLIECPLTGDASVIAKHVKFLATLPKPVSFDFLGCFEMELRAIGFVPQAEVFDGDGAMILTGQIKFAQGAGDTPDSRTDVHTLYIGLPRPGSFIPRLHLQNLPVNLNLGAAFRLNGVVEFVDTPQEKGFSGEGVLQIQGLPTIAASFSFLRVRRDESSPWLRAWFIYLEVRQVSFPIPQVQIYLREVGLGFGYRYTLASIKAADRANDVRELLRELKALSGTQGDLSKRDRWAIDLEEAGQDPRWTIALRAMISQTSASPSPLRWNEIGERDVPCVFLLDAVIALRSDLTFLMATRAWLNANYYDYVTDYKGLRGKPLFNGFVLLSARQKRLLANLSSNPDGQLGPHPPLPDFVQKAIAGARFTATLLVEPGLLHAELGWPNQLGWTIDLGPLKAEVRGGFIFRISERELVIGASYLARASLRIDAGLDLAVVGVRISASADLAYGARFIGVLNFADPANNSALYGAMGLEAQIRLAIEFWLRIPLLFTNITKTFRLSAEIGFTAGIEAGFVGVSADRVGLRGSGTLSLSVMGHSLQLNVKVGVNEDAVATAFERTNRFLQVGLEATDVEGVPGVDGGATRQLRTTRLPLGDSASLRTLAASAGLSAEDTHNGIFHAPDYSLFVIRAPGPDHWSYLVLLPQGERPAADGGAAATPEPGFLPAPPNDEVPIGDGFLDFRINVVKQAQEDFTLQHFDPTGRQWVARTPNSSGTIDFSWKARWDAPIARGQGHVLDEETGEPTGDINNVSLTLRDYLRHAFITEPDPNRAGKLNLTGDPDPLPQSRVVEDERVQNPSDSSFEAAVRGAVEQFEGSPFFKRDPSIEYERVLNEAFKDETTIYRAQGVVPLDEDAVRRIQAQQQAMQLRGMVVQDLIADLREYVEAARASQNGSPQPEPMSVAFEMGLVFRIKGLKQPAWLDQVVEQAGRAPAIRQRVGPASTAPSSEARRVRTFNIARTDFSRNPPQFQRVQQLTDANTIALAWSLEWEDRPDGVHTEAQADPEHHLMHYQVRRRALEGAEPEAVYTVKNAQALHRPGQQEDGEEGILQRLQPRFRVVDHFTKETQEDLEALPASGRSYLYTITPFDFTGNPGRPLTLVATRYPNEPPQVPADAELVVRYRVGEEELAPENVTAPTTPRVVVPEGVHAEWTESNSGEAGPTVAVRDYYLVFRKSSTMPVGSYGLDSTTQGPRTKSLPTTNARPLPTDIKIPLRPHGTRQQRTAEIPIEDLQEFGVLPGGADAPWRPESWRVFMQTVSVNGVPSALAPVQLLLRVEAEQADVVDAQTPPEEREERRPAELEWLPFPIRFAMLPPEDERATRGTAHVPMPAADGAAQRFVFPGEPAEVLGSIRYEPHPVGTRCVRFRWNQGPSDTPEYPLDLNAGYQLLELDIDAHTDDTFVDVEKLSEALRMIQDVQMVPAEDLLLTPGDTLATNQWEAWYPSAVRRRRSPEKRAQKGSEIAEGPWFSWRESLLEWPEWPAFTDGGGPRSRALHPLLQTIVDVLGEGHQAEENGEHQAGDEDFVLPPHIVDLQISPPIQPGDLAGFFKSTAPEGDPYGWGVLQRFGLCVAFSLRGKNTGEVVPGNGLLEALKKTLKIVEADTEEFDAKELYQHLHVELLFQPGRSVSLEAGQSPDPGDLLAVVQLSLRPVARQYLTYRKFEVAGPAGESIDLILNFEAPAAPLSVIDQADPASGQAELESNPPLNSSVTAARRTVRLPLNGRTKMLLRSKSELREDIEIGIVLTGAPDTAKLPQEFVEYRDTTVKQLVVKRPLQDLNESERGLLREALADSDKAIARFSVGVPTFFSVADEEELSAYFTVPETLAGAFGVRPSTDGDLSRDAGCQWLRFKRYAESLNSTDPDVPPELKIGVPTGGADIGKTLPDFLAWSQRFFDAGGDVSVDPETKVGVPGDGPWLATAYPRVGSPAYATPDEGGRLVYDHLLEDQWAHTHRYYLRPYGRYDLLWQSFRTSPALSSRPQKLAVAAPDPNAGGLDVVLERVRPVERPLVLSSGRLDAAGSPASPAAPGKTWEVIIAQHPEQVLVERNAALARQLAFRQVAFTLLRRFAYPEWVDQLEKAVGGGHRIEVNHVQDRFPAVPTAYPDAPDHLDLDGSSMPDAVARSIDLPDRLGAFQQGALVLQWEALPFYYEHRLALVAQTDGTVSPANEIVQRDFEYRSPDPSAKVEGVTQNWQPRPPFGEEGSPEVGIRARGLSIPLQSFWDCLPEAAREQWASEAPDPVGSAGPSRKLSSLPDREVVYQIVELFSGNIEVQAELFFDQSAQRYACRQLGRRFLADLVGVAAPPGATPQAPYLLGVTLLQVTDEQLTVPFNEEDAVNVPEPTLNKIATNGTLLSVASVFTKADRDNLLDARDDEGNLIFDPEERADDRAAIERLYQVWFSHEPVSRAPQTVPARFADLVTFPESTECTLVWRGSVNDEEREHLLALSGDDAFRAALARIVNTAADAGPDYVFVEAAPAGLDQVPQSLGTAISFEVDSSGDAYTRLVWSGPLFDAHESDLRRWARIPAFIDAVNTLVQTLDRRVVAVPLPPEAERPNQETLPDILNQQLTIRPEELEWRGRLRSVDQLEALQDLPGGAEFREALQTLAQELTTGEVAVEFTLPVRPEADELPGALRSKLLIGRALMRYHGIMTPDEGRALQELFELPTDREAIRRLYDSSLSKGMRGRELMIRARRGSAPPSGMRAPEPKGP